MKKRILLTKPFYEQDLTYIKERLHGDAELIFPSDYKEDNLVELVGDCEVMLGGFISKKIISTAKNLELIQVPWTGVDKINFEELQGTNAVLCNSHSNSLSVAEHTVALFFALVKSLPYHDKELRSGNWNRPNADSSNDVSPFSPLISTMKIGILGFGAIGSKIYTLLQGFNSSFHICSNSTPNLNNTNAVFYSSEQITDFLQSVDVVFVCLPLTEQSKNLIDREKLTLLKDSYIINTARGEIIDEQSLYELLESKHIKGAAIDTWTKPIKQGELPSLYPFHELQNVLLSSHRSGMIESSLPHLDDAITNINNLCEGKPLINIVNINKKY